MAHNTARLFAKFRWVFLFLTVACSTSPGQIAKLFVVTRPQFVIQKVEPAVPREALRTALIGNGAFDVCVDETGIPTDVKLVSWKNVNSDSLDRLGLDQAVMTAIRKWRFNSFIVADKIVPFQIRIGFLLHPKGLTFTTSDPQRIESSPEPDCRTR